MKGRSDRKRTKRRRSVERHPAAPFPLFLAGVLSVVVVLALSYIWVCARCDALGREIKKKEQELAAAQKRLVNEQDRWSCLTSPANLRRALRKYGLNMVMPEDRQIVRLRVRRHRGDEGRLACSRVHPSARWAEAAADFRAAR